MDPANTFINALFLCLLNVSLMVAGIFLNSVVIISLWRSSQHRKKLCYFTILFLSCFDLAEVTITHSVLILSTILWFMHIYYEEMKYTFVYTGILFGGFSMFALLTLTIERFLALTYPFFHQTAVTKRRLVFFQTFWMITLVALSPFYVQKIGYMLINVFILSLLFLLICLNYKMFIIAKSKRKEGRVGQTSATTSSHQQRKRRKLNFKNISTCSLAVACFYIPHVIYETIFAAEINIAILNDAVFMTIICILMKKFHLWVTSTLQRLITSLQLGLEHFEKLINPAE